MGKEEKLKVKVGNKVYDSLNEPIVIIYNVQEEER